MTQQEFENLTGLQVSFEEYEVANAMYMSHDNMDKQTFCEKFMEMGLENYMRSRAESTKKLRQEKEAATARAMEAERENAKIAERDAAVLKERDQRIADLEHHHHDWLHIAAEYLHTYKSADLLDAIRDELGTLNYYKCLLSADCNPTKADLEMFIKELEGKNHNDE